MRCRQCDYQLWNTPSRRCPECSAPFLPSDYHFTPGRVTFHCPHCQQAYTATAADGRLSPQGFECTGCHQRIHMNDMILQPLDVREEAYLASEPNPWLERETAGRWNALWRTVFMAMGRPGDLMDGTPKVGGVMDAFKFACVPLGILPAIICSGIGLAIASIDVMRGDVQAQFHTLGLMLVMLMVAASSLIALLVLATPILDAALRCTGRLQGNLGCTFKVLAYNTSHLLITVLFICIPPAAVVIFLPWWLVCVTTSLSRMHNVHPIRSILAVAVTGLVLILLLGVWMLYFKTW